MRIYSVKSYMFFIGVVLFSPFGHACEIDIDAISLLNFGSVVIPHNKNIKSWVKMRSDGVFSMSSSVARSNSQDSVNAVSNRGHLRVRVLSETPGASIELKLQSSNADVIFTPRKLITFTLRKNQKRGEFDLYYGAEIRLPKYKVGKLDADLVIEKSCVH